MRKCLNLVKHNLLAWGFEGFSRARQQRRDVEDLLATSLIRMRVLPSPCMNANLGRAYSGGSSLNEP